MQSVSSNHRQMQSANTTQEAAALSSYLKNSLDSVSESVLLSVKFAQTSMCQKPQ